MQDMDEIYKKYSKIVYRYLFCLTHNCDIAEEITQETFYIALKDISKFRKECKMEVWLCQIAKFIWYKELKKNKRNVNIEEINNMYSDEDIEENMIRKDEREKLYSKLELLDKNTKEVILLRITSELSFKQIGDILGKNETWARVTFYRGKEKLKEVDKNDKKAFM